MDGAPDLHPHLLLVHLPYQKGTNTTSLEGEAPPQMSAEAAAAQLMGAKSPV